MDKRRNARIILGDNQAVFRAGIAEVLSTEDGFHMMARCQNCTQLYRAIDTFHSAIVIVASALKADFSRLMSLTACTRSRIVIIAENTEPYIHYTSQGASGVIFRNSTSDVLVDCVRRIAAGDSAVPPIATLLGSDQDLVGTNVRNRLTPKELRILSLIVQGERNRGIAARLHTTEQVIKNYLVSIFDKAGVSDRLELALFAICHPALAAIASQVGAELQRETIKAPWQNPTAIKTMDT